MRAGSSPSASHVLPARCSRVASSLSSTGDRPDRVPGCALTSRPGASARPHHRYAHESPLRTPAATPRCPVSATPLLAPRVRDARDHGTGDADAPADQWCRQSGALRARGTETSKHSAPICRRHVEDGWRARNASHHFTTPLLPLHTAEPPVRPLATARASDGPRPTTTDAGDRRRVRPRCPRRARPMRAP